MEAGILLTNDSKTTGKKSREGVWSERREGRGKEVYVGVLGGWTGREERGNHREMKWIRVYAWGGFGQTMMRRRKIWAVAAGLRVR